MFSIDSETFQIKLNPNSILFKPFQTKYQVSMQISYHIEVLRHFGSTDTNLNCNKNHILIQYHLQIVKKNLLVY